MNVLITYYTGHLSLGISMHRRGDKQEGEGLLKRKGLLVGIVITFVLYYDK
jgi:hypothetical protein